MADLMGRGYVIEHCIAAFYNRQQEKIYRGYITDALKILTDNTAAVIGITSSGGHLQHRWAEIIEPKQEEKQPEDPRPCHEIATDIFKRIRGEKT